MNGNHALFILSFLTTTLCPNPISADRFREPLASPFSVKLLQISNGKLRIAFLPRILKAALSYAFAASIAVSNVPNHTLDPFCFGSRISAAYFPHGRRRIPL
ncbi:hypothetical protein Hanom_Chr12g01137031 [Helianthus anomalus]